METRKMFILLIVFTVVLSILSMSFAKKRALPEESSIDNKIILEYEFTEPVASKTGEYDLLKIKGLELYKRVGAPIVPVRPVEVLVPFGKKAASCKVAALDIHELDGAYCLAPAQESYPLSYKGEIKPTKPNQDIYGKAKEWPGKNHEQVTTQSKRGYQILVINLFPMQYIPKTGKVSYAGKLRLEITLAGSPDKGILRPTKKLKARLSEAVDNSSALSTYEPSEIQEAEGSSAIMSMGMGFGGPNSPLNDINCPYYGENWKYIVITSPYLADSDNIPDANYSFQALCDEKEMRGIPAGIVDTDWIYDNYDPDDYDPDRFYYKNSYKRKQSERSISIRMFLMDAYKNWGTEYVLLGGYKHIIPPRIFYHTPQGDGDNIAVDMYYGCVEPNECTFDYDKDGKYGEPNDGAGGGEVDLCAEIYVGRAAVEDGDEVVNFVRKTLAYNSSNGECLTRAAMLGEHLGWEGVWVYAKEIMEQIRLGGTYDGYFTYGFNSISDFNTEGCHPDNPSYCWPLYDKDGNWSGPEDLIPLMNSGMHIFNHLGHAGVEDNMKLTTSQLSLLTNTDYFFVYSQGCRAGRFDIYDEDDCFAEVITTMEHGAFAVIMNSRVGVGNPDGNSTDGRSQRFNRQFWDAAIGENILEIGRANQDSKEDNLWDINGDWIRWCYYELNLFGDPETRFNGFITPEGRISFDQDYYNCSDEVKITLTDSDLIGANSMEVHIEAFPGGDVEAEFSLAESNGTPGLFTSTIYTDGNTACPNDGILQLSHGDTITVTYYDANDGNGVPAEVNDTAGADCEAPTIFNVEYGDLIFVPGGSQTVTFETSEPTYASVFYGTSCGDPNYTEKADCVFSTEHSITFSELSRFAEHYFEIEATDGVGNVTVDDNDGNCYNFFAYPINVNVPGDYNTIQQAITGSYDECIIWVADGNWASIDFGGKGLTVRSMDPEDPNVVEATVIDANSGWYAVESMGPNSVLNGFTITGATYSGIYLYCSCGTIKNCVIEDNGGCGIYQCECGSPISGPCLVVEDCIIRNNERGIYADYSSATIEGCDIYGHDQEGIEAGLYESITMSDNIIYNNDGNGIKTGTQSAVTIEESQIYGNGGDGIETDTSSTETIRYNEIYSNNGDGINTSAGSDGIIGNNKIYGNANRGILTSDYAGTVENNLIYDNYIGIFSMYGTMATIRGNTIVDSNCGIASLNSSLEVYNCILWNNDLHDLYNCSATYSCIEDCNEVNGTNHNICDDPCFVNSGENKFNLIWNSPCIDKGDPNRSYEGQLDIDNGPRVRGEEVDIGADEAGNVYNVDKGTWYEGIQDAIDEASNGDDIVVFPGTYGNINYKNKYLTIRSIDPNDWDIVAETVIDAADGDYAVRIYNEGDANSILSGFTITDGDVAGITANTGRSIICNCIIRQNEGNGISATSANLVIKGNKIYDNGEEGIKISRESTSVISGNQIYDNTDGIKASGGNETVNIKNNLIYGNSEVGIRSGRSASISNNTVVNNSCGIDASDDPSGPTNIYNCIVWGNNDDLFFAGTIGSTYNCIGDCNDASGTGNICGDANAPCFVDADSNDFHIAYNSPCINAGDPNGNYYGQVDIDGEPRVMLGRVDMGADETIYPDAHWWMLDETSGTTAYDSVGNSNGTFNGDDPCWVDGLIGGAVDFNGASDYFLVSSLDNGYNNSSVFTAAGWFNTESSAMQTIVGQWSQYGGYAYFGWQVLVEDKKVTAKLGYDMTIIEMADSNDVNDGAWHHFAMVYPGTGGTAVLYVDGESVDTCYANFALNDTKFRIGDGSYVCYYSTANEGGPFNGKIDDVMIFDRVLSPGEVEDLFNIGAPD